MANVFANYALNSIKSAGRYMAARPRMTSGLVGLGAGAVVGQNRDQSLAGAAAGGALGVLGGYGYMKRGAIGQRLQLGYGASKAFAGGVAKSLFRR